MPFGPDRDLSLSRFARHKGPANGSKVIYHPGGNGLGESDFLAHKGGHSKQVSFKDPFRFSLMTTDCANHTPQWRKIVGPFAKPCLRRASFQVLNTLAAYVALWIAMYFALSISSLLLVPLIVMAGGLLVRVFIIFHDCTHDSFFRSRFANRVTGFVCGIFTFTPYQHWRWEHTMHHASSGDLDRRGIGDIWTMTVAEYASASKRTRLLYRIARNPVVMFLVAPVFLLTIYQRFSTRGAGWSQRISVWSMNVALALAVTLLCWVFGWKIYLLIQLPIAMIAGGAGVWLFYVQHQFEDVVWERRTEWDFAAAAMQGSSYYKLPRLLQWFSGNIGFHHIHHLSPRIPNYHLQGCHESHEFFSSTPPVTLRASLNTVRLKLWDEKTRRLVGFGTVAK